MSDTPAPLLPNWITKWGAFIKAHERLIIIILAAFLLFRAGQGIENMFLKHDAKASDQAADVVKVDEQVSKQLAEQLSSLKADAAMQSELFRNEISLLKASLSKQKAKDVVSTPSEIDSRWLQLLPLRPGSVSTLDATNTKITNESANQTVQALEEIPVLKTQVADLTTELQTDQKLLIQQDGVIMSLNKEIVDEKLSHAADVKLEKAKGKHSFWKGFKIGLVVGVVGSEAVRIWAGHP